MLLCPQHDASRAVVGKLIAIRDFSCAVSTENSTHFEVMKTVRSKLDHKLADGTF